MKIYLVVLLLLLQGCAFQSRPKSACESAEPLLEDLQDVLYTGEVSKAKREEFWDLYYVLTVNCSYDSYDSEEATVKTVADLKKLYDEVRSGQASQ
jgi:hypothetical protein